MRPKSLFLPQAMWGAERALILQMALLMGMTPCPGRVGPHQAQTYGNLPLVFTSNRGQADQSVHFIARGRSQTLFLTATGATLSHNGQSVRMKFAGANPAPRIVGLDSQPGTNNVFVGNDPSKWHRGIPTFGRVLYEELYPGVDLIFRGADGRLEYDFVLAPGADPARIRLAFDGTDTLEHGGNGDLVMHASAGVFVHRTPVVWQEWNGRKERVPAEFIIQGNEVAFLVRDRAPGAALVIDPEMVYSTYLGGSGREESVSVAIDSEGCAYLTGTTDSSNFPAAEGAAGPPVPGNSYAFIAKINPAGTALIYSTFLASAQTNDIAVDSNGNAYVAGVAGPNFPVTPGAYQTSGSLFGAGFVTKLDPTGDLAYSTYFASDGVNGIAVDVGGNAYITGSASPPDFQVTPGAFQRQFGGGASDAFVAKLDPFGSSLVYSTYLGGAADDGGAAIAVNSDGHAYITGTTRSYAFPTTTGSFQTAFGGDVDVFVAKLNPTGTALEYSSYLGGANTENGPSIAVDPAGSAYISGTTRSTNFPVTAAAFQRISGGWHDVFLTKVDGSGSVAYSTLLGGDGSDYGYGVAVDPTGNAYVVGSVGSEDFPTTADGFNACPVVVSYPGGSLRSSCEAFLAKFNAMGTTLEFGTGLPHYRPYDVALDRAGNVYVSGQTSGGLPVTSGVLQSSFGGGWGDAFLTKFRIIATPILSITTTSLLPAGTVGTGYSQTLAASGGVPPYTWLLAGGALPGGLTLSSAGAIAGTPIVAGTSTFTAQVIDGASANATRSFELTITAASPVCTYTISPGGQAFSPAGGLGTVTVTTSAACAWTAGGAPNWVAFTSAATASGDGSVSYRVSANDGAARSGTFLVAGRTFTIEQSAVSISGIAAAGSIGHIASQATWKFTLDLVNLGATRADARINFLSDTGESLPLPLLFPQAPADVEPLLASSLDRSLGANELLTIESTGPDEAGLLTGWSQLQTNGAVTGFGIFSNALYHWGAVVPLETRNAQSYWLVFDNTGAIATGVAIANVSAQAANIVVSIRDEAGYQIDIRLIHLESQRHTSFMLDQQYPVTAGRRGTLEFVPPSGGQISVLGLRANGSALTTLPVLANIGNHGGSFGHFTFNGGFSSVFYLANTFDGAASVTLNFLDNTGNPREVPLFLPQSGASLTVSQITRTISPGALLVIETQAQDSLPGVEGSVQLTTNGEVGAFEVFRWTTFGQEASVPLESRTPGSFVLVFDNTGDWTTGVALANVNAASATVTMNLRDDRGALLEVCSIPLVGGGHTSFMLPDTYAVSRGKRGTAEFIVPANGNISLVGLRAGADGTLTTIPVLPVAARTGQP